MSYLALPSVQILPSPSHFGPLARARLPVHALRGAGLESRAGEGAARNGRLSQNLYLGQRKTGERPWERH